MVAVTTQVTDCSLDIKWISPDPRGKPIINFNIVIKGKDG
jgi:hypothetical protein